MLRDATISIPGARLRLTQSDGPGMPVLMVHGSGSSRAAFARQLASPLADSHRMIAVDLPGHGDSSDAEEISTYSLRGLTAAITSLVDALELERFALLGWSLGGHIGMEMLSDRRLAGVMVCGAPPLMHGPFAMLRMFKPSWDMLLAGKEQFTERDVARYFGLCFGRGATQELFDAVIRADGRLRVGVLQSMMRGDFVDERRAVEHAAVPVALVNGRDDPFVRLGYLDGLSGAGLWHGMPIVIEEAGHAPFWDQPDAFNELLAGFIDDAIASRITEARRVA
jgi:pimeloyl-ACP methyl ester carboxylesterase